MGWSFRIARVAGIEVRIHVTFLLLLAYFGYQGYLHDHSAAGAVASLVRVLSLFLCVLLHEFGHAMAAARYGIKTPDIKRFRPLTEGETKTQDVKAQPRR